MADVWGPWIEHDGKGCPCVGMWVCVEWRNGDTSEGIAGSGGGSSWDWSNTWSDHIIRYRIRRPDALRNLIDLAEQVEDLTPETVKALVGV